MQPLGLPIRPPRMNFRQRNTPRLHNRYKAEKISLRNQPWQKTIKEVYESVSRWGYAGLTLPWTEQELHSLMDAFFANAGDRPLDSRHEEIADVQFELEIANARKNTKRPVHRYAGPSQREHIKALLFMAWYVGYVCIKDYRDEDDLNSSGFLKWNCGNEDPSVDTKKAWDTLPVQRGRWDILAPSSGVIIDNEFPNPLESLPGSKPRRGYYHPYTRETYRRLF